MSQNQASSFIKESGKVNTLPSPLSIGVLQEIGRKCSSKVQIAEVPPPPNPFFYFFSKNFNGVHHFVTQVEFKAVISTSNDLQFSFEVSGSPNVYSVLFQQFSLILDVY